MRGRRVPTNSVRVNILACVCVCVYWIQQVLVGGNKNCTLYIYSIQFMPLLCATLVSCFRRGIFFPQNKPGPMNLTLQVLFVRNSLALLFVACLPACLSTDRFSRFVVLLSSVLLLPLLLNALILHF